MTIDSPISAFQRVSVDRQKLQQALNVRVVFPNLGNVFEGLVVGEGVMLSRQEGMCVSYGRSLVNQTKAESS